MWTMLSPALAWTSIGIVAGIPLALLAGRAASSLLFGLSATNAGILTTSAAVMFVIGLLAAYLPARRASQNRSARCAPLRLRSTEIRDS